MSMLTLFQAAILGIVQGLTEFLPISSTAHLTLAADLLRVAHSDYVKSFEIVVQSGSILAVVWLYWRRFLETAVLKRLAAAFIPTGILGFALYPFVKQYLLGNVAVALCALAAGGLLLILLEKFHFAKKEALLAAAATPEESRPADVTHVSYRRCVALGLFQVLAMVPGVSRSGATVVGGLLMGIPRRTIVELSFLLAVPTMFAATGLDLAQSAGGWTATQLGPLAVGFAVSFATALAAIKWLLAYVQRNSFAAFGAYRLLLAGAFLLLWL